MPQKRKPVRGQLGLRSRGHRAYVVSGLPIAPTPQRPTTAHGYAARALRELAAAPRSSLWVLEGEVWFTKAERTDPVTGEPIASRNDEVLVVNGAVVMTIPYDELSEAWLRGFVRTSADVQAAEAALLAGGDFATLEPSTRAHETALATEALAEVERGRRAPSLNQTARALFDEVQAKKPGASWSLEVAAFRERNLAAWRYARAVSDGKTELAKMYASRVKL